MGKKYGRKMLSVAAVLLLLCMTACTQLQESVRGVTVQGQTVYKQSEAARASVAKLRDLDDSFDVILQGVTKEFIAGYAVDRSFLMWLDAEYGDDVIVKLAGQVKDQEMDASLWRTLTGSSIHVLWLRYCQTSGFQNERLERVHWMDTASGDETVISFAGDFSLAEDWYTTDYMDKQANGLLDCFSADLVAKMRESDIFLLNNEFPYSERGRAIAGKAYTFRADPTRVKWLSELGVDGVSLANNHVYDYGANALEDTFATLEEQGIPYVGAGRNLDEASGILSYVANGQKISIVSATEIERATKYTREATSTQSGVLKTTDPELFLSVIREAKKTSDYVIAVIHWGTEGNLFPDSTQQELAGQIAAAGADAIIGGHPHRLQGTWFIGDVPVAYSLGNFWFSDATLYTTLAQIVITDEGLSLRYLPCVQEDLTTRLLTEQDDKEEFYQYLGAISGRIGIDDEGFVYNKDDADYPAGQIVYDAENCTTPIRGGSDNDGYAIDIVGNR